jgi:HipA-like C-terminal domain
MAVNLTLKLLARLRSGTATSPELQGALGVSQSAVSVMLRQLIDEGRVMRFGRARAVRYGLRRPVESIGSQWPLRRITETGDIEEIGSLFSLAADEYYLDVYAGAQKRGFSAGGLSSGLPYFLQDQRPGGFLGRMIPMRHPELELPKRVIDWSDEQYLRYLTQYGADAVSDLILGDRAFDRHLAPPSTKNRLKTNERAERYPLLADEAMADEFIGSSAQGDHPKFTAMIDQAGLQREVLVKFSPSVTTAVGQRWADLLIAEHHALETLSNAGVLSAKSGMMRTRGRVFLEVERFDRQGNSGRVGVSSLFAIDAGVIGGATNWLDGAQKLFDLKRIDESTLEQVRLVFSFGGLIANTDRHFGNLAFFDHYDGHFTLAPIYDMLPMLFAPAHDEIVERVFEPPGITSVTLRAWPKARELAEQYWDALTRDERIGQDFRGIAERCLNTLSALPRTGAYAHASGARR